MIKPTRKATQKRGHLSLKGEPTPIILSSRNWPSGPMIHSCSLTWARSPSSTGLARHSGPSPASLAGSAPTDSIVRKLFALIARCHQMLGDLPAALNACNEGIQIDPNEAELHFRKALLRRKAGQPADAEACWQRILTLKRPDQFCSVDQGIYGHLTLRNLAVLAEERGDPGEEAALWDQFLAECPGDGEAIAKLDRLRSRAPAP